MKYKVTQVVENRTGEVVPLILAKEVDSLSVIGNVANILTEWEDEDWFTTISITITRSE